MDHNYQRLNLQGLIDLLAEETERYTKAFTSRNQGDIMYHNANIQALISKINKRKREDSLSPNEKLENTSDSISDATPTATE
jgi:hypothetical protein